MDAGHVNYDPDDYGDLPVTTPTPSVEELMSWKGWHLDPNWTPPEPPEGWKLDVRYDFHLGYEDSYRYLPITPPQGAVLAIGGLAGSGKSAATEQAMATGDWERLRFSAPLKAMLRAFYDAVGATPEEIERRIEGDLKELPDPYLNGQTPRYAMQTLGEEWGRQLIDPELWVSRWNERARALTGAGVNVLCEDLRYANEADAIRSRGGTIVVLKRNNHKDVGTHPSETLNYSADYVIDNNGTLSELHRNMAEFVEI
jgi:hypothetical protein